MAPFTTGCCAGSLFIADAARGVLLTCLITFDTTLPLRLLLLLLLLAVLEAHLKSNGAGSDGGRTIGCEWCERPDTDLPTRDLGRDGSVVTLLFLVAVVDIGKLGSTVAREA